jgi:hypothetical protein
MAAAKQACDENIWMDIPSPDVTQAIGELAIRSSQHEHAIKILYGCIMGLDSAAANDVLGKRRISDIRDECEKIFEYKSSNKTALNTLRQFFDESRELMSQRNEYLHSATGITSTGSFIKKDSRKNSFGSLKAKNLKALAVQIHELNNEILSAIHQKLFH